MKKSRIVSLLLAFALLTVALAVPALPHTIDGASVRTTGDPGLRFYSTVSKADLRAGDVVEYGTILIPTESLTDADEFVIGATLGGRDVAKVPAVNTYLIEGDTVTFTAVIIKIKPEHYTRAYSARSYITYNEDGEEKTVYSDEITSRDVYTVAKAALENDDLTDAEAAYLTEVVEYVEGKTYAISYTEPDEDVLAPSSIEIEGCTTTVSWTSTGGKPHSGKFESGTDYTVVITITKDTAFGPKDKVTINGKTVAHTLSNDGKTMTVTKTYDLKDSGFSGIY